MLTLPKVLFSEALQKKKSVTAPFNNMRTLKFKAQPTNAFSLLSIKRLAAPPSFLLLPGVQ